METESNNELPPLL